MATPLPDPDRLLEALATQMKSSTGPETGIVGIYTGGAWVAERLHRALGMKTSLGQLAVTLHRDDFGRIGLHPEQRRSHLPFDVEGRDIVLVDDVLHTGRTVRAALNELWDFGRPGRVRLAVLADRGGRELPFAPDFCGGSVEVGPDEDLVLTNESGKLRLAAVRRPS